MSNINMHKHAIHYLYMHVFLSEHQLFSSLSSALRIYGKRFKWETVRSKDLWGISNIHKSPDSEFRYIRMFRNFLQSNMMSL